MGALFRTLYAKLAATFTVLILLLGLLFYSMVRDTLEMQQLEVTQQLNRGLARQLVEDFFVDGVPSATADKLLFDRMMKVNPSIEIYRLDPAGRIVSFDAPDGHVVRSTVALAPVRSFLEGHARFPLRGDDPRDRNRSKIFSAAPIGGPSGDGGYLYVVIGGEALDQLKEGGQSGALHSAIVLMLVALGGVLLVGFVAFRLLTARLARLSAAMDVSRRSGFAAPVLYARGRGWGPGDEIDRLGATYNAMIEHIRSLLDALRASDAQRRDLIANVSHDLRTPLTALRGYLDTLLLKGDSLPAHERTAHLTTAARQSERLGHLVTEFFELAKLDARDVHLSPEPVMLDELAQDVLQGFALAASQRGIRLDLPRDGSGQRVVADIRLLERMLANLIDNAIRHTDAGGIVAVRIESVDPGKVRITVSDTGAGIPADALAHVFERSFTLDRSRSGETAGSGLGLTIVKRIVDLHGGMVSVTSRVGEGAWFVVELPVQAGGPDNGSVSPA